MQTASVLNLQLKDVKRAQVFDPVRLEVQNSPLAKSFLLQHLYQGSHWQ